MNLTQPTLSSPAATAPAATSPPAPHPPAAADGHGHGSHGSHGYADDPGAAEYASWMRLLRFPFASYA